MRKFTFLLFLFLLSCSDNGSQKQGVESPRFHLHSADNTGIDFVNTVQNSEEFNIFSYRNFYNGGGVAIGDLNNDGLADVFFTANMGANKLYLNRGDFKFEDITTKAGVEDADKWSTGVALVDINADGWLDIYVCNAGFIEGVDQRNSLYLNNHDLTFTEAAADYGLNDNGYTTHAGFFDYDLDGDLDVYLLNNSFIPVNTLNYSNKRGLRAEDWPVKDFLKGGGDKLLRNDDGKFVDVSEDTGIYGSLIGFGLGVTLGDVNGDDYPDIYVSNDFFERDYLYLNQQDGTFSEELENWAQHISHSSMGADMADINNDDFPEVFVTDMLPDDEYRLKTTATFDNISLYQLKQKQGFYHQYMQNTLQLNDHNLGFREIAYYSGVSASDWSWGALIFDADNDAHSDIYVCNGIYHDVINQDFIDFFANEVMQKMALTGKKEQVDSIISKMPSVPLQNKVFRNQGDLRFADVATEWGFEQETFSNGAAYGDLDNDGDLDLVINNVNQASMVFENHTERIDSANYLSVRLTGTGANTYAIGAKVKAYVDGQILNRQLIPTRGFQSSIDYTVSIGLGTYPAIDSLVVVWPDRQSTRLENPAINQLHEIKYEANTPRSAIAQHLNRSTLYEAVTHNFAAHQEDDYIDFYFERNVPVMVSHDGPRAAFGDVDGDGIEDVYIGGAAGHPGQLYLGTPTGFVKSDQNLWEDMKLFEDTAVLFFDRDGDGDLDLFVGSGGNHQPTMTREMQDRLYVNDGQGNFELDTRCFPTNGMNTSVATAHDFDGDGDLDLFVGSRSRPNDYGQSPESYLYENDGQGHFTDWGKKQQPALSRSGLVTDADWLDLTGDGQKELVLIGEWMSPQVYRFEQGQIKKMATNLEEYPGWWYSLAHADVDGDGDEDLFLGNLGENFYLQTDREHPLKLWMNDFDQNGSVDKVITRTIAGRDMPVPLKKDLAEQIASLKKQNLQHESYANKAIQDLFSADGIAKAIVKKTNYLKTSIAINEGNGQFKLQALPAEVQLSCVNDALFTDLNEDGYPDLVLGGNNHNFLPQYSRLDASIGQVLLNDGKGSFSLQDSRRTGLRLAGEIKQLNELSWGGQRYLMALRNNEEPLLYRLSKSAKELF